VGAGHNLLIRILNVIIGLLYRFNHFGLILGNQIGRFLAVILYSLKNIPHELKSIRESLSLRRMLVIGRTYKNYPLFILPSQILENLKGQSAVYFIGIGFNKMILGNFSISISVLSSPIQILANSISSVFLEKANDLYQNEKSKFPAFVEELIIKLFLIGVLPFSLLVALGERIIIFFLGDEWKMAGEFSSILGPYFFVMLVISPILSVLQILRKEREILFFNIIGFSLNILSLAVGYFFLDIILLVTLFSISNLLIYTAQGIFILRLVKLSAWKLVIGIFIIFPFLVLVFKLLALLLFG
jgi:O-antigen/teichoic acid export membrane protein